MDLAETRLWIGCLVAGSWLNLVLYTTEAALFVFFVPRWKLSPTYKYGFYIIILNDAVATYCVCANLMMTVLDGYPRASWPVTVLLMSTGLSAFMEQTFLIHRYYTVGKSMAMSTFLMLVVVAHLAMLITATVYGPNNPHFPSKTDPSRIAAALCTTADVLIALSIVWSLSGIRPVWRSTQQLIRTLCLNALTSGAIVATLTMLSTVTNLVQGVNAIIFSLFFASLGRVYSLTVLVNIIIRNAEREVINSVRVSDFSDIPRLSAMVSSFHTNLELEPRDSTSSRGDGRTREDSGEDEDEGEDDDGDDNGRELPKATRSLHEHHAHASLTISLPDVCRPPLAFL
ncbi:hypothetical protein C8R44DRAFT_772710 [Mycena epipterygia]|nr:hypothetical protein C8R44DRAFT_772710 [Mycena epipterygia]